MAMPSEKLNYSFAFGIDEEVDSRVMPENLIGCKNGVWRRDRRIEKRPGLQVLANENRESQQSLIVAGDKLALIGQNDFSTSDARHVRMNRVCEQTSPAIRRQHNIQSAGDVEHCDVAYCDGYTVVVYSTTEFTTARRAVYYQVLATDTGAVLVPETLIFTSSTVYVGQARVENVSNGGARRAHIYYLQASALRFHVLDLEPPATLSGVTILATISATAQNFTGEILWHYDTSNQSGAASVVVYWDNAIPAALTTKKVSPDGATVNTVTTAVTQGVNRGQLAIYAKGQITDSVGAVLLYQQSYNTTVPFSLTINTAYAAVQAGPTSTLMTVLAYSAFFIVRSDDGTGLARRVLFVGNDAASDFLSSERIQFADFQIDLTTATFRTQLWGTVVAKPYWYVNQNTTPLCFPVLPVQMYTDVDAQPNVILTAVYGLTANKAYTTVPWGTLPVGRLNVDTAQSRYLLHPKGSFVAEVPDEAVGSPHSADWLCPVLIGKVPRDFDGVTLEIRRESRPDILRVSHSGGPVRYAEQADNAYLAAGALQSFTGGPLREQAYNFRPYFTAAGGVGFLAAGTYQYTVIFEQYDERGDLIRSSPAESRTVVLAAPGSGVLTIRLPVYVASQQPEAASGPCRIAIFRTSAGGSLFNRVATIDGIAPGGVYTTWPTVAYTDALLDVDLEVSEPLYADIELPSDPTPAPIDVAVYQERIAIISAQEPDEVWISKQKAPDVAAEFSAVMRVRVAAGRGDGVALAAMDEKLVIFKESSIYAIAAEGPNALGQGTFGQAREVSSDIGCINKHSVDVNEAGIFFESPAGIYLLDRGLNLNFIGGPVIDKLPADGTVHVMRTVSVQAAKEIYFLIGSGEVLCYNYRWGRWTWHEYAGSHRDIAVLDDKLAMLTEIGGRMLVRIQSTGYSDQKDDGADFYSLLIQSPWFKLGGLQGWQRTRNLRFLAEYASAHNLVVRTYHDNDDTAATGTWTFLNAAITPGAVGRTYGVKVKLPRQKSQSVRFELEDTQVSVDQVGFKALDLMVEYAVKPAGVPVPVARKG